MTELLKDRQKIRTKLKLLFGVTLTTAFITNALTLVRPESAVLHLAAGMQDLLLIWQYFMLRRLQP